MGLYLAVIEQCDDVGGVDVGSYEDFNRFRELVCEVSESGAYGSVCPVLQLHEDCDGEWPVAQLSALMAELERVYRDFSSRPPRQCLSDWQREVFRDLGLKSTSLADSIIDVDGEPLIVRLMELCRLALKLGQPISYQ